jgi:hypothetical protein
MNIEKWLAETLSSIKAADPSELMRKMEEYGLVEDDPDAFKGVHGILSQVSEAHKKHGSFVAESEHSTEWVDSPESVMMFSATPRNAASCGLYNIDLSSSLISCNTDWQLSMSQAA